MKEYIAVLLIVFTSGCLSRDDALYAPWSQKAQGDPSHIATNLSKVVNNQYAVANDEPEYCVTNLKYPHQQACTKESDV